METEGMRKALKFLEEKVNISEIVTDASKSIMSLFGEIVFVCLILMVTLFLHCIHIQKMIFQTTTTTRCTAQVKKIEKIVA